MAHDTGVAVVLAQALAIRDDAALSTCLDAQDPAVIAGSVEKLNAAQALSLLEALVERLHRQPQQAARLAPWLRSLLLTRGTALASTPAGQAALQLAHQLLEERTATFGSLLSLSGRLQLLQPPSGGASAPHGAAPGAAKVMFSA